MARRKYNKRFEDTGLIGRRYVRASLPEAQSGQGIVEFALVATALLFLLFGALQMVLIFNAALAVSQYSYSAARYASVSAGGVNPSTVSTNIRSNVPNPPTINNAGLSAPAVKCTTPAGASDSPCSSGDQVAVTVTFSLTTGGKLVLPSSFFPTSFLSSSACTGCTGVCLCNTSSMMVE